MYNIISSYVPLHKNRTILLQIGRPHFKDIIDHLKSHKLCFSSQLWLSSEKQKAGRTGTFSCRDFCRRPERKQICDTLKKLFWKKCSCTQTPVGVLIRTGTRWSANFHPASWCHARLKGTSERKVPTKEGCTRESEWQTECLSCDSRNTNVFQV